MHTDYSTLRSVYKYALLSKILVINCVLKTQHMGMAATCKRAKKVLSYFLRGCDIPSGPLIRNYGLSPCTVNFIGTYLAGPQARLMGCIMAEKDPAAPVIVSSTKTYYRSRVKTGGGIFLGGSGE